MAKQPPSRQLETPAQPPCLCEAGGVGPKRSLPHPSRCPGAVRGRWQSSVHPCPLLQAAAASQQLPGSPAASKHMPLSLSLLSITSQGAFRHPGGCRSLDFRARASVFSLPCDCSAGEGLVRETGGLRVYDVLLKRSF